MSRMCDDAMAEDLLIEELSRRIAEIQDQAMKELKAGVKSDPLERAQAYKFLTERLAREVLRQMRYAYANGYHDGDDRIMPIDQFGVEIAPPDWTP